MGVRCIPRRVLFDLRLSTGSGRATVRVEEVRAGTMHKAGAGANGVMRGAAYVFNRDPASENSNDGWVEEAKLVLDAELAGANDRFGWALALESAKGRAGRSRTCPS